MTVPAQDVHVASLVHTVFAFPQRKAHALYTHER